MVHGLGSGELGHWWQHTKGVHGEHHDVFGVTANGWQLGVRDVLEWVSNTGVFRDADVGKVDLARVLVIDDVLHHDSRKRQSANETKDRSEKKKKN